MKSYSGARQHLDMALTRHALTRFPLQYFRRPRGSGRLQTSAPAPDAPCWRGIADSGHPGAF